MGDRADHFELCSGRTLPAGYRTFLEACSGGNRVVDGEDGFQYTLATSEQLLAPYTLDGTGLTRPFFSAHILHLARLRDAGVLIFDGGAEPVSPERFESMNTIGTGGYAASLDRGLPPTHLLVLDPADGSLRCVPTDPPAAVRRVADSFEKWFKKASRKPRKTAKAPAAKSKAMSKAKPKPPTPATVLGAFKKKNKLTLPLAYAKLLKAHDGTKTFTGPAGEQWTLATLAELADPRLGAAQTACGDRIAAIRLTRVFADAVQAEQGVKFVPVYGTKLKFTLARLRKGVCIGHCNGDVLFLDPTTKYSVWGYSREGRYVGKVADRFAEFVRPKLKKPKGRKSPARPRVRRKTRASAANAAPRAARAPRKRAA